MRSRIIDKLYNQIKSQAAIYGQHIGLVFSIEHKDTEIKMTAHINNITPKGITGTTLEEYFSSEQEYEKRLEELRALYPPLEEGDVSIRHNCLNVRFNAGINDKDT